MIGKINQQNLNAITLKNQVVKKTVQPTRKDFSFSQILQDKVDQTNLKYSKHADLKMKSLGIARNSNLEDQLKEATSKARGKNIKEGLMLTRDYGFVVSVKNNTVITVVSLDDMKDNVFTNIDGAVII